MRQCIYQCLVFLIFVGWLSGPLSFSTKANDVESATEAYLETMVPTGFPAWDFGLRIVIENTLLHRLPGSWKLEQIIDIAPGITCSQGPFVHGAHTNDNQFQVDGISQRDIVTGTNQFSLTPEVVDTVEIKTGSLKAEHGGFMGGLFQVKTLSGTNDWHGSARLDFIDTSWNDDPDHVYYGSRDYDYMRPTLTLRGPILQDRLWFLGSYSFYTIDNSTKTIPEYGDHYSDVLVSLDNDMEYTQPFFKLSAKPVENHRIDISWFNHTMTEDNFSGDPGYTTPEAWSNYEASETTWSFNWDWIISSTMQFHLAVGSTSSELDLLPKKQSDDPRDAPFRDSLYGHNYNNSIEWMEDTRESMQYAGDLTWLKEDLWGDHRFKVGIQYESQTWEEMVKTPGGAEYYVDPWYYGSYYDPDYFMGSEAERSVLLFPGTTETCASYMAIFFQDDWQITDRLNVDLGLRFEQIEYENDAGETDVPAWSWGKYKASEWRTTEGIVLETASMSFDSMLSPRLRLAWDLTGEECLIVHGSYGRYYNKFDHQLPDYFQPFSSNNYLSITEHYVGPEWSDMDRDGVPDEDYFFDDANWVNFGDTPTAEFTNLIDPDLEAEYTDEFIVGLQHNVNETFTVGINYVYRKTNDLIEDVGLFMDEEGNIVWTYLGGVNDDYSGLDPDKVHDPIAPGRSTDGDYTHHVYYVTNAQGNSREYSGIEIHGEATHENWDLQASYTYSKAEGSVIEGQEDYSGIAQFSGQYDTYGTTANLYGELPWSCRHYVKVTGSYHFDVTDWYEMSFGINAFCRSGYHYSKRGKPPKIYDPNDPAQDPNDENTWSNPPYRSFNWSFLEPRGQHELPSYYNIDFSFQNTFKCGRFGAATVIFDIENLTDNQSILSESDIYNPNNPELFGSAVGYGPPRNYRLSLKYAF